MKIEKGMYVRTENGIKQIYKIDENKSKYKYLYKLQKQDGDGCIDLGALSKEDIIGEPSFDLIDLIEVGDILHSNNDDQYWTVENYLYKKGECINIEWKVLDSEEKFLENIDEIITKEQAKSVSYKIGE